LKRSNLSNLIILILVITITILISIGSYYKIILKKRIYEDALIVNQLGQIRGNIQRYAKLKIVKNSSYYPTAQQINKIFNTLTKKFNKDGIIPSECKKKFFKTFNALKIFWKKIEVSDNKQLIKLSEEAWNKSNYLIYKYEQIHKLKFSELLKNIDLFIYVAIIFLTAVVFIIYTKIKKGLEKDVIIDSLTGLYNRLLFDEEFKIFCNRAKRYKKPLTTAIIDIDNFKKINDTYGHKTGDKILKEIGHILKYSLRRADLPFRYGGEEFVILFPNTPLNNAKKIIERVRKNIEEKVKINGKSVTISGGIGEYIGEKNINDFFRKIDEALYKAKNNGKNKIVIAN